MLTAIGLFHKLALRFGCDVENDKDTTIYKIHKTNEKYLKDMLTFLKNNKIAYDLDRDIYYYETDEGMKESYYIEIIISKE